jgi:hypothetical protein
MKIKHSKFRNTGLIFELLIKQVASDTLNNKDSAAISVIKKHFANKSTLAKEYKLYEFIVRNRSVSQSRAEAIVSTITEVSRKLDQKVLKNQKYDLIANIKEHYDINEFFGIQVRDYKALAALYCLLEGQNAETLINPQMLVDNKTTILEHLTSKPQDENEVKDALVEEYSKYDKDLKLLTFKILLEKFNDKYKDLLPEQKRILKEFITSVNSGTRLRNIVNKELDTLSGIVSELAANVDNQVVKIKLDEVSKAIKPVSNKERIDDNHLVKLMQYYELVNELKKL